MRMGSHSMCTVASLTLPDQYSQSSSIIYSIDRNNTKPQTERYSVIKMDGSSSKVLRQFRTADGAIQYAAHMLAEDIAVVERR